MTLKEILGAPLTRDEALELVQKEDYVYEEFLDLPEKEREDILEFIQGIKGLPILYDGFYKHVFDPECNPERLENRFDSGVKVNLLSNLTYICLDTFSNVRENIDNKMDAWLTFLSSDKPEDIIALVEKYPEFAECYRDVAEFRRNPKELIGMFSKALLEMDRNTVKYMIEEQQKELEAQQKELEENKKELEENQKRLEENRREIEVQKSTIDAQAARIAELEAALEKKE